MVAATREQLLAALWERAALLDDRQLERVSASMEEMTYPERAPRRPVVDKTSEPMPYVEFIAELSAKLGATGEAV